MDLVGTVNFRSFSDQDGPTPARIVVNGPSMCNGTIQTEKVSNPALVAPLDDVSVNEVAPGACTFLHPMNSQLGRSQPQVHNVNTVSALREARNPRGKGTGRHCRLKCETGSYPRKVPHTVYHDSPCLDRSVLGSRSRKSQSDSISIDVLRGLVITAKQILGKSRLAGSVGSGNDN